MLGDTLLDILQQLIIEGNKLDRLGLYKLADQLDYCIVSLAEVTGLNDIDYNKEERMLLRQRFEKRKLKKLDISHEESLLSSYGIIPIDKPVKRDRSGWPMTDGDSEYALVSQLGVGAEGTVTRASYKGKEVAAKITAQDNEANIWRKIAVLSRDVPEQLSRHIPKVYKIISTTDSAGDKVSIVIMEILKPLPRYMLERLFGQHLRGRQGKPLSLENIAKNEQVLFNAACYAIGRAAFEGDPAPLQKELLSAKFMGNEDETASSVSGAVMRYLNKSRFTKDSSEEISSTLASNILLYLKNLSSGGTFPLRSGDADDGPWLRDAPESKSLYEALKILESNGIRWADLHRNNLMWRESTGDPVIIDVGQYKIS